ncbi:MAG TPA: polyprenyl synthetase family protein [Propionicimonas sp.]|nr:polyprenyl synthetase family protein [Propionicimonas sp.]HQA76826.1 polyprenyl synthetase family protein [Propionicimonas sp.]HQD95925.1 polyprenyl synthetase family protein [Propionicimonas sp.]
MLERIEQRLADAAIAQTDFVTEAAQHIISAGGKRFRPLLVVLAALLRADADDELIIRAALVMELTHVASLYHDDVMDEAELRRGAPSANQRWDNTVAILVGDFLFARASALVATLGTEYVKLQADTFARLVQGQIAETRGPLDGDDRLEHYLDVVSDKTGSLIAASTTFGGMVAAVSPDELAALAAYGEEIGVVFQLSDDIIDIASDTSGKTPGTDLRAGVPTLPTLLARRSAEPSDARLLALLDADLSADADLAEALGLMRAHPAMAEAREVIHTRAEIARGHLAPLPEGPVKQALSSLCDGVISRSS